MVESSGIIIAVAKIGGALPEIRKPIRKISLNEIFWTGLIVIIYLIM
ncbi:MAG: hypothetical protein ACE5KO_01470 [Candidatus Bathyarchaeia archaeon]